MACIVAHSCLLLWSLLFVSPCRPPAVFLYLITHIFPLQVFTYMLLARRKQYHYPQSVGPGVKRECRAVHVTTGIIRRCGYGPVKPSATTGGNSSHRNPSVFSQHIEFSSRKYTAGQSLCSRGLHYMCLLFSCRSRRRMITKTSGFWQGWRSI